MSSAKRKNQKQRQKWKSINKLWSHSEWRPGGGRPHSPQRSCGASWLALHNAVAITRDLLAILLFYWMSWSLKLLFPGHLHPPTLPHNYTTTRGGLNHARHICRSPCPSWRVGSVYLSFFMVPHNPPVHREETVSLARVWSLICTHYMQEYFGTTNGVFSCEVVWSWAV